MKCPCGVKLVEPVHPNRIYCDECRRAKRIAAGRAWQAANRELKLKMCADWYQRNRKNNEQWRAKNKRRAKAWRKKHLHWIREYRQQYAERVAAR
jgi:hypothetical protein